MAKQMILRVQRFVAVSGVLVALPGCSGSDLSRAFGLERSMPDEYTVTTQPPLSMPPGSDLNLPGEGGRKLSDSASMQALETLAPEMALRRGVSQDSAGQRDLVKNLDEAASNPQKGQELQGHNGDLADQILFWKGRPQDAVVDGEAENRRIRDASAMGRNPANGVTHVKSRSKGFLGVF